MEQGEEKEKKKERK